MWRPENNVQEELVCFPRQVLGIELRSDGPWQGFHLMSHLTGPALCAFTIIIVIPISFYW